MNGYIVRNQRAGLTSEALVFSVLCKRAVEWRKRMHTGQLLSESREDRRCEAVFPEGQR